MPSTILFIGVYMEYERLDSSDQGDQATALEALNLQVALQNQKLAALDSLKPRIVEKTVNGKAVEVYTCLFCHSELEDGLRFCDEFCRDDWEKEQRMKKITGRI